MLGYTTLIISSLPLLLIMRAACASLAFWHLLKFFFCHEHLNFFFVINVLTYWVCRNIVWQVVNRNLLNCLQWANFTMYFTCKKISEVIFLSQLCVRKMFSASFDSSASGKPHFLPLHIIKVVPYIIKGEFCGPLANC